MLKDQDLGNRHKRAEVDSLSGVNPAGIQSEKDEPGFVCPASELDGCMLSGSGKEVRVLATVTLREGESQESLLKRFRKSVMQERILSEVRRKRWYISPSEKRRIQRQRAIRRARRRQRQREARRRNR
jgi:small subunit ribosomal protein S21